MALAVVQSQVQVVHSATTATLALDSAPAVGNILIAFVSYESPRTATAPDASWNVGPVVTGDWDIIKCWWHVVVSGDVSSHSYDFTVSGAAQVNSGTIYEISGAHTTTPINKSGTVTHTNSSTFTTASVTPDVLGTLPLCAFTCDYEQSMVVPTCSISSGWTIDQSAAVNAHASFFPTLEASHGLTTDTTTAISGTLTLYNPLSDLGASIILLIAPAASPAGNMFMVF